MSVAINMMRANYLIANALTSYEDLFAATGGARLGMRARAKQSGKLKRTEEEQKSQDIEIVKSSESVEDVDERVLRLEKKKKKKKEKTAK